MASTEYLCFVHCINFYKSRQWGIIITEWNYRWHIFYSFVGVTPTPQTMDRLTKNKKWCTWSSSYKVTVTKPKQKITGFRNSYKISDSERFHRVIPKLLMECFMTRNNWQNISFVLLNSHSTQWQISLNLHEAFGVFVRFGLFDANSRNNINQAYFVDVNVWRYFVIYWLKILWLILYENSAILYT